MTRLVLLATLLAAQASAQAPIPTAGQPQLEGWLNWRGPLQCGVSLETDLPDAVDPAAPLWTFERHGRGTPVIANGRVYVFFYTGEDQDLQEGLACLDERTGAVLWEDRWSDFISDVVYDRYSIGAPTIDPETGNVFLQTTTGVLKSYTPDGRLRWERSTMEDLGRLTFPNGRTGAPLVDEGRVIIRVISAHWGRKFGPAGDHWYAFDTDNGDFIWESRPGIRPIDSPYSFPVIDEFEGRRLLYAGTGCGQVVCVDSRTGEPQWRFPLSGGGVCSSPLVFEDRVIAINGKENLDTSTIGRMVAIKRGARPMAGKGPLVLGKQDELWRNPLGAFTSSLVRVGKRIYNTDTTGELCCTDIETGEVLWRHKLASDQIHASPVYADGKLYVPMTNGSFHVLRPTDGGPEVLSSVQLEGSALGAPAVWNGRLYVHTTERLYVFGDAEWKGTRGVPATRLTAVHEPPRPTQLQLVTSDTLLKMGEALRVSVRTLDQRGRVMNESREGLSFELPKVLAASGADGGLVAVAPGVGTLTVRHGDLSGSARVRVVRRLPWTEDFEGFELNKKGTDGSPAAFPPSYWTGVFKKWEVVEQDGNKVLRKTLNMPLFQRSMGFNGHEAMSNYTVQVDVMSDGNRRTLGAIGVVNQRYQIIMAGNLRVLEVSSNHERIKEQVPFRAKPGVWYTLKTRVDVAPDGSGVIRGKCWPRATPEPEAWTIEVAHHHAHTHGSPGIYGFTPQSRFHVYVDNFSVTPND
jgi:outer membrane protein assembly factor BamB